MLSYKVDDRRICEGSFLYMLGYSYSMYASDIPSQYLALKKEFLGIEKKQIINQDDTQDTLLSKKYPTKKGTSFIISIISFISYLK